MPRQLLLIKKQAILNYPISNLNRSVGAILSNEISKIHEHIGLPEDTFET
jgi:glutamate synthase (ferredoxin)